MKVFASLFSKSDWGSGLRPAIRRFLVLFCAYLSKKERRGFSQIMLHRIFSREFGRAPSPSCYHHPRYCFYGPSRTPVPTGADGASRTSHPTKCGRFAIRPLRERMVRVGMALAFLKNPCYNYAIIISEKFSIHPTFCQNPESYSRREPNSYALRREFFASSAKSRLARCISCFDSL